MFHGMCCDVQAIDAVFYQDEIADAAYRITQGVESGERAVVGVNRFVDADEEGPEIQTIDEAEVRRQGERLRELRAKRNQAAVDEAPRRIDATARGTGNLPPT